MKNILIRAWQEQGIPGGWGFTYEAITAVQQTLKLAATGQTPHGAVQQIYQLLQNNACADTEADVWAVALQQWYARLEVNGQGNRIIHRPASVPSWPSSPSFG